jgi:hypothetical protein
MPNAWINVTVMWRRVRITGHSGRGRWCRFATDLLTRDNVIGQVKCQACRHSGSQCLCCVCVYARPSHPATVLHHIAPSSFSQRFRAMDSQRFLPRVPNVTFRVLIIGRANAGKTTILQRVCDTTESPLVYRIDQEGGRRPVRSLSERFFQSHYLFRLSFTPLSRFTQLFFCWP